MKEPLCRWTPRSGVECCRGANGENSLHDWICLQRVALSESWWMGFKCFGLVSSKVMDYSWASRCYCFQRAGMWKLYACGRCKFWRCFKINQMSCVVKCCEHLMLMILLPVDCSQVDFFLSLFFSAALEVLLNQVQILFPRQVTALFAYTGTTFWMPFTTDTHTYTQFACIISFVPHWHFERTWLSCWEGTVVELQARRLPCQWPLFESVFQCL